MRGPGEGESTHGPFHPPQDLYIAEDARSLPSGCSLGGRSKCPICAVMSDGAAINAEKDADRCSLSSTRTGCRLWERSITYSCRFVPVRA
jgi:hypothetical protein